MLLVDPGKSGGFTYVRDIVIKIYSHIMFIDHSMLVITYINGSPHTINVVGADLSAVTVGKQHYRVGVMTDYIISGSLERQLWSRIHATVTPCDTVRIIKPSQGDIIAILAQIDYSLY